MAEDTGRRPITCDRCGTVWWVDYSEATRLMQSGRAWIAYRQERVGETIAQTGKLEAVPYLKGTCLNCDRGVKRPDESWVMAHIGRRRRHMLAIGIEPENAATYAIEEYLTEFHQAFHPEFQKWFEDMGWVTVASPLEDVDLTQLPEEYLGEEKGLGDGGDRCPHVNKPVDWGQFGRVLGQ